MAFVTGGTERVRIIADGNVGIGTDAPATTLTVAQTADSSGIRLYGYDDKSASYMNFRIDSTGHTNFETSGGLYTKFDIGSGYFMLTTAANEPIYMDFGGNFYWRDRDASNAIRMTLQSNTGNLGIGTTAPAAPLHVTTNVVADTEIIRIQNLQADTNAWISLYRSGTENGRLSTSYDQLTLQARNNKNVNIFDDSGNGLTVADGGAATFSGSLKAVTILDTNDSAGTSGQILTSTGSALDWKTLSEITGVDGTGTAGYVPKWTDTDTIGNSVIREASSKIGIGVSPDEDLHVSATAGARVLLTRTASDTASILGAVYFGAENGDKYLASITSYQDGAADSGRLDFTTEATGGDRETRMTIKSDGKVGIGTTSPSRLLTVNSTGQADLVLRSGNSSWCQLMFGDQAADNVAGVLYDNSSSKLHLNTSTTGSGGIRLTIDNAGLVGIGTTAPSRLLHLNSSGGGTTAPSRLLHLNSSGGTFLRMSSENADDFSIGANSVGWSVYNEADSSYSLVVDNTGKVGIGTTAPLYDLHIKMATGNTDLKLESDSNAGDVRIMLDSANSTRNANITFFNAGTQVGGVGYVASDTMMKMWGSNNPNDDHLCIASTGNVGIGTTSPDAKLDVNGTLRVGNSTRGHYLGEKAVTLNGTTYTTALTIVLSNHNAAHVKLFLTGDWNGHSAVAYVGEYFIQNGSGGYNEPGMIISEFDNTATDFIESKIVDPSTDTFTIQLKLSDSDNGTMSGHVCYHVMGEVTSVT